MKKVLLLGREKDLGDGLSRRMSIRGYSIKETRNLFKAMRLIKLNKPDFVLCTGRIQQDSEGNYYLDL